MTAIIPQTPRPMPELVTVAALPRDRRRLVFAGAGASVVALALVLTFRSSSSRPTIPLVLPVAQPLAQPVETVPLEAPRSAELAALAKTGTAPPRPTASIARNTSRPVRHATRLKKRGRRVAMAKRSAAATAPEPGDPRPSYEQGTGRLFAGDGPGAIVAYREAVRQAPTDPIGYRGL